jgi:hypothetical protein
MFKLVAIIFVLSAGAPEETGTTMIHKTKFDTEAACQAYKTSDAGLKSQAVISFLLARESANEGQLLAARYECQPVTAEDGAI